MEIEVETLGYEKATAPDELFASLGPCIAIGAIYEDKGYLLHTQPVGWENFAAVLNPILFDLTNEVRDKAKLKLFIAGGSLIGGEYVNEKLAGRQVVLEAIKRSGFFECIAEVRWATSCQTLTLLLDQKQGLIEDWELPD